jgi:hypothetical protein
VPAYQTSFATSRETNSASVCRLPCHALSKTGAIRAGRLGLGAWIEEGAWSPLRTAAVALGLGAENTKSEIASWDEKRTCCVAGNVRGVISSWSVHGVNADVKIVGAHVRS